MTAKLTAPKSEDVTRFIATLEGIASGATTDAEAIEARAVFDWSQDFIVSRAPGRLDVMGGIADYSGSLVLQMPIAEAACCALQVQSARSEAKAPKVAAQLRVVSFGAGAGGRSPSFTMPLSELYAGPGGSPTPLATLRARFVDDPGIAWAAYVVGVVGVLIHETTTDQALGDKLAPLLEPSRSAGLSLILGSSVPEGKGVSSSAAVEVATMMALLGAADHELTPSDRVALLCQKAENLVVGAPCGGK